MYGSGDYSLEFVWRGPRSIKRAEEEFLEGIERSESAEMRAAYAAYARAHA